MNADASLVRGMGLPQAIAANMLNMIGVGPFITIPLILAAMGGPQAMLGWFLGLLLALCDGLVWAELGAALPGAGGAYVYLREAYGPRSWGRLMSFLFIWMICFVAPLGAASGAVGFANYLKYFWTDMSRPAAIAVAMAVCLLVTALNYRDIRAVGWLSVAMLSVVVLTTLWVIAAGLIHFDPSRVFDFPPHAFRLDGAFFKALGAATLIAIYDYGGYNNICYLAGEVVDAPRTVPRAVILSIALVAAIYVAMSAGIISVVPWREAIQSNALVSDMLQRLYGDWAGAVVTALILWTTLAALFALILGYARIPFAAATDGQFFAAFARLHPTGRFPHVSLLVIGGASAVLCLFRLDAIINALITIQILIHFLPQVAAVTLLRRTRPDLPRPFRMWLYPLPGVLAAALWGYIWITSDWTYVAASMGVAAVGVALFLGRSYQRSEWPFAS
jgi:amino acid transporter